MTVLISIQVPALDALAVAPRVVRAAGARRDATRRDGGDDDDDNDGGAPSRESRLATRQLSRRVFCDHIARRTTTRNSRLALCVCGFSWFVRRASPPAVSR